MTQGNSVTATLLSPRGGNEVCIKCIESFCCHHFNIVTISVFSLKQDLQTTLRRCCLILVAKATTFKLIHSEAAAEKRMTS